MSEDLSCVDCGENIDNIIIDDKWRGPECIQKIIDDLRDEIEVIKNADGDDMRMVPEFLRKK